jgi:hypothetical protein
MYIVENIGDVNVKCRKSHWSNGEFPYDYSFRREVQAGNVLLTEKFDVLENMSEKCATPGVVDVRNIGNFFRHPCTSILCHPVSLTEFPSTFITVYFCMFFFLQIKVSGYQGIHNFRCKRNVNLKFFPNNIDIFYHFILWFAENQKESELHLDHETLREIPGKIILTR